MGLKRVLFYIEPVTYANSPYRLQGWWNFFSSFAARSTAAFVSSVAASPMICAVGSTSFEQIRAIDQIPLLQIWDFDRAAYSRDLCSGVRFRNKALLKRLNQLRQDITPDLVISASDNRYLRGVFGQKNVMFMELGPLPRSGLKPSIYVDPFGHQIGSALNWFGRNAWDHPGLQEFAEVWQQRWVDPMTDLAKSSGIAQHLKGYAGDRKLMLAALQPPDWITYEGIGPALDPVSLLRQLAADVDPKWMLVPQWHGSDNPPTDALIDELVMDQPNIVSLPEKFRISNSEIFLPIIDGVATISSNVAAAGVILGKELKILGMSKFKFLQNKRKAISPRIDVLAFLASRYCQPLESFVNEDGAFASHIERLWKEPQSLFDSRDMKISDLERFFV